MTDEPQHSAMARLSRLEARLESLSDELVRVKGRLAEVESVLARLASECSVVGGAEERYSVEHVLLDLAGVSPSLSPDEECEVLAEAVQSVRARQTPVHILTDDEKAALTAALQNGVVSFDEAEVFRQRRSKE